MSSSDKRYKNTSEVKGCPQKKICRRNRKYILFGPPPPWYKKRVENKHFFHKNPDINSHEPSKIQNKRSAPPLTSKQQWKVPQFFLRKTLTQCPSYILLGVPALTWFRGTQIFLRKMGKQGWKFLSWPKNIDYLL